MNEQYTVRVYNKGLIDKIERLYKKSRDIYPTKNPFFVDCIKRGMEDIEKEYFGEKKIETLTEIFDEIGKTISKLNELIKLSKKNSQENLAHLEVIKKLLSSNYHMLIGISNDTPKNEDYVEAGMYDQLPERLCNILEDLINAIENQYD